MSHCSFVTEEDRKSQREERLAKLKLKREEAMASTKSPTTPPTPGGGRLGNPFKMSLPAVAPTPELGDSEEDETQEVVPNKSKTLQMYNHLHWYLNKKGAKKQKTAIKYICYINCGNLLFITLNEIPVYDGVTFHLR